MARVIVQGEVKEWKVQVKCVGCKSVIEISATDLIFVNDTVGYDIETWNPTLWIKCPVCKKSKNVTSRVPSSISQPIYDQELNKRRST
jgi:hypothetical protein